PVVAQVAKEIGILTVAVVTKPFPFEMRKRAMIAEEGIKELSQHVDSLIIIPNEKLLDVLGKEATLIDAFKKANDVLYSAVQGISELITRPGLINVDFADVTTVMQDMGLAMMGSGYAKGEGRARKAGTDAISSPLLEDVDLKGAKGILVNMTAGMDLSIGEFAEMGEVIKEFASENATVVVGTALDPEMNDELRVTVIATGVGASPQTAEQPKLKEVSKQQVVINKTGKMSDYKEFDKPTVARLQAGNDSSLDENDQSLDYLDVPSFLRQQAS
ncbi:MAG: cell division protein FtsZ, partial [Candidatus Marithrix sp.]|nr:cell division protein FtsZ [Candidatus Marithrix sp.]